MSGTRDTLPPDDELSITTTSYNPFFALLARQVSGYLRNGDYEGAQQLLQTAAKYLELIYNVVNTTNLAGGALMHPYLFAAGIVGSSIPIPAAEGSASETGWQNTGFTTLGIVTTAQAAYTALLGMTTAVSALSSGTDADHPEDLSSLYAQLAAAMTTTGALVAGQLALGQLEGIRSAINEMIRKVDQIYYSQAIFITNAFSDDPRISAAEKEKIKGNIAKANKALEKKPDDPKIVNNLIYYHAILGNFTEMQTLLRTYVIGKKIPLAPSFGGYSLLFILYQAKSRNPALKSFDIFDLLDKIKYPYATDMRDPVAFEKSDFFEVIAKDTCIGIYAGILNNEIQQAIRPGKKATPAAAFAIHAGPIKYGIGVQDNMLSGCFNAVFKALKNPASKDHELCVNILKREGIKLIKFHMVLVLKDVFERLAASGVDLNEGQKRELFNKLLISVGNVLILDPYGNMQALRDKANQEILKDRIFSLLSDPNLDISKFPVTDFDKVLKDICGKPSTSAKLGG